MMTPPLNISARPVFNIIGVSLMSVPPVSLDIFHPEHSPSYQGPLQLLGQDSNAALHCFWRQQGIPDSKSIQVRVPKNASSDKCTHPTRCQSGPQSVATNPRRISSHRLGPPPGVVHCTLLASSAGGVVSNADNAYQARAGAVSDAHHSTHDQEIQTTRLPQSRTAPDTRPLWRPRGLA